MQNFSERQNDLFNQTIEEFKTKLRYAEVGQSAIFKFLLGLPFSVANMFTSSYSVSPFLITSVLSLQSSKTLKAIYPYPGIDISFAEKYIESMLADLLASFDKADKNSIESVPESVVTEIRMLMRPILKDVCIRYFYLIELSKNTYSGLIAELCISAADTLNNEYKAEEIAEVASILTSLTNSPANLHKHLKNDVIFCLKRIHLGSLQCQENASIISGFISRSVKSTLAGGYYDSITDKNVDQTVRAVNKSSGYASTIQSLSKMGMFVVKTTDVMVECIDDIKKKIDGYREKTSSPAAK